MERTNTAIIVRTIERRTRALTWIRRTRREGTLLSRTSGKHSGGGASGRNKLKPHQYFLERGLLGRKQPS